MKRYLLGCLFISLLGLTGYAQTGISVSDPRVYFEANPGETVTKRISVTNVSEKSYMDISLSLADWTYNEFGENVILPPDSLPTSFVKWISINEGSYFSLKPGETKELTINATVPSGYNGENTSVRTALLFASQMNPSEDIDSEGTSIKISVRSGVKLYFRSKNPQIKSLEITGLKFDAQRKTLLLSFENKGNIWTDGIVYTDLLNTRNGKEVKVEEFVFYTLPGNKRTAAIQLPKDLSKGDYVATVLINYGDDAEMEAAELKFSYE
jgi:P pilus assembly chaperone PapD